MTKQNDEQSLLYKGMISVLFTFLYMIFPPFWICAFFNAGFYKKFFKNKATTIFNCYVLPPLAVVTVFFTVFYFKGIYPFGNKTIAWCDMTQQGVPYILNFKSILEGDDGLFINMANAGGMDGWSLLKGNFLRPFNYLVLLVDRASVMEFISVITVLKLAACSVTAMVFFRTCVKKLDSAIAVSLSLMYSFCAFGTMYYQILNWPDAMYIMPLYFTGLYLLIKEHKIALFAVSLSFVMLIFSFGFMTVIATLLLMGYYFIVEKDVSKIKQTAFDFTVGSALAAILCSPSWLSFFGAYNDSARGVNLADALAKSALFTTKNTAYPLLMSTAFIFVGVFIFRTYKKDSLSKALYFLFGMMMIPMLLEPINKMWHAGSYMGFPNRFAFILIFCGLAIAGIALSKTQCEQIVQVNTNDDEIDPINATKKVIIPMGATVVLTGVCYYLYKFVFNYTGKNIKGMDAYATTLWGDSTSYKHMLLLLCVFIAVYVLGYFMYKKGWITKRILALFMIAVVVCEGYISINTYVVPPTTKVKTANFRAYGDLADRIEDEDFYRIKNTDFLNATYSISEANFPGAIGYNCLGHYSSFTSESYLYAAKAYGYSSVWMKIESFGGTKFSDALFNVKYQIEKTSKKNSDTAVYSNEKYCINETEYHLPLGLFTSEDDLEIDVTKYTRMQLQEKIFDMLTDGKSNLFQYVKPTSTTDCSIKYSGGEYKLTPSKTNGRVNYSVKVDGTKTLYFDCFDEFSNSLSEKINGSFDVYVNNVKKITSYPKDTSNGLINLGTFKDTTVNIRVDVKKNVSARSFGVYAMDDILLSDTIDNLSSAGLSVDGNDISGNYTAARNGYLFISVPYHPSYTCMVNGVSVEPIKAFGSFIAIPVTAGENTISVSYTPDMFYPSIIMMLVGIAIAIVGLVMIKRRKLANSYELIKGCIGDKTANVLSTIAFLGVLICFITIILIVYIYPMFLNLEKYL